MNYSEEQYAIRLQRELDYKLKSTVPAAALHMTGGGVHWHCKASAGDSTSTTHCFDLKGTPEYYTTFERTNTRQATARTNSLADTIAAIIDWMRGVSVHHMHESLVFVDQNQRALQALLNQSLLLVPRLNLLHAELENVGSDIWHLWFKSGTRSCKVSFWGKNSEPDARFFWDECHLFQFRVTDVTKFTTVLDRWLVDDTSPSIMRSQFPWLSIDELADYYEAGRPVEGEFIMSWKAMFEFYNEGWSEDLARMAKAFMTELVERGYNKTLRAGQSLSSLILSRSRRHGLVKGQSCIQFWFRTGSIVVNASINGKAHSFDEPEARLTPRIAELLNRLESVRID